MATTTAPERELLELPVSTIKPNPNNPRADIGDVAELASSIAEVGVLEPLLVSPDGKGHFILAAGHRRLAAAKLAKLKTVPAIVSEISADLRDEISLIENLHRTDLAPLEEAVGFARLRDEHGYAQKRIAERIGVSQGHVSKRLNLLKLPAPALDALSAGKIGVEDALELVKIADHPEVVAEVLKSGPGWGMRRSVENAAAQIQRGELIAKATEQAKAGRAPFRPMVAGRHGGWLELPKGSMWVQDGFPSLDTEYGFKGRHAGKPCHAVTVNRDGKLVAICTDPAVHKDPKRLSADEREARKAANERKRAKVLAEANKTRAVFLTETVLSPSHRIPREEALAMMTAGMIRGAGQGILKRACALLELEPKIEKGQFGSYPRFEPAVRDYAAAGAAAMVRLGVALSLASHEERASWTYGGWKGELEDYFAWLERRGYTPSKPESDKLAGKGDRARW